jgi:hypothetical protein
MKPVLVFTAAAVALCALSARADDAPVGSGVGVKSANGTDTPPPGEPAAWRGEPTYGSTSLAGSFSHASFGQVYFHKTGASLASHNSDLGACTEDSKHFWQRGRKLLDYSASGKANLASNVLFVRDYAGRAPNIENCMVVRGWEVVRIADEQGKALRNQKPAELAGALAQMVGAEKPPGAVVRRFTNELATSSDPFFIGVGGFGNQSISFASFSQSKEAREGGSKDDRSESPARISQSPAKPATIQSVSAVPAGQALLLVRFVGEDQTNTLEFRRLAEDGSLASAADSLPNTFVASRPIWKRGTPSDAVVAFTIPPGRWVLAQADGRYGLDSFNVHFCYGAPAFDLKADEVVFAGSFASKGKLAPSMDLGPIRNALASRPELASKVRAATYRNGVRTPCDGVGFGYAVEFPEFPFVDGYRFGSRANLEVAPRTEMNSAPLQSSRSPG